jgi:hypothetical protein
MRQWRRWCGGRLRAAAAAVEVSWAAMKVSCVQPWSGSGGNGVEVEDAGVLQRCPWRSRACANNGVLLHVEVSCVRWQWRSHAGAAAGVENSWGMIRSFGLSLRETIVVLMGIDCGELRNHDN